MLNSMKSYNVYKQTTIINFTFTLNNVLKQFFEYVNNSNQNNTVVGIGNMLTSIFFYGSTFNKCVDSKQRNGGEACVVYNGFVLTYIQYKNQWPPGIYAFLIHTSSLCLYGRWERRGREEGVGGGGPVCPILEPFDCLQNICLHRFLYIYRPYF